MLKRQRSLKTQRRGSSLVSTADPTLSLRTLPRISNGRQRRPLSLSATKLSSSTVPISDEPSAMQRGNTGSRERKVLSARSGIRRAAHVALLPLFSALQTCCLQARRILQILKDCTLEPFRKTWTVLSHSVAGESARQERSDSRRTRRSSSV